MMRSTRLRIPTGSPFFEKLFMAGRGVDVDATPSGPWVGGLLELGFDLCNLTTNGVFHCLKSERPTTLRDIIVKDEINVCG
jgi:hypothetical protein